jgi:hypothetical protein
VIAQRANFSGKLRAFLHDGCFLCGVLGVSQLCSFNGGSKLRVPHRVTGTGFRKLARPFLECPQKRFVDHSCASSDLSGMVSNSGMTLLSLEMLNSPGRSKAYF